MFGCMRGFFVCVCVFGVNHNKNATNHSDGLHPEQVRNARALPECEHNSIHVLYVYAAIYVQVCTCIM